MRAADTHHAGNAQERPASEEASYVEKALGLALLLVLAIGCFLVLEPFLNAILLAVTLCVSTWPLFRRTERLLGGRRTPAAFVMAWNGLFVGNLDNVLRPYLISRGIKMPMVLIFLGVLGGALTFGIVGVFLGPVMLAVAYTLFQDWGRASETGSGSPRRV
jgi:predicted PurR-regulated permease PerM